MTANDEKWREALNVAKNIIFGAYHQATRERDYAKAHEYQSYMDDIDAALTTPPSREADVLCADCPVGMQQDSRADR